MQPEIIALWVMTIAATGASVSAVVAVLKFSRNGKLAVEAKIHDETQSDTTIRQDIKHIKKALDDPQNGLSAIKSEVESQKVRCAQISTELSGRITGNEKTIDDIKKVRRSR